MEALDTRFCLKVNWDFLISKLLILFGNSSSFGIPILILLDLFLSNSSIFLSNSFIILLEVSITLFPFSNKSPLLSLSFIIGSIINSPRSFSSSKFSTVFQTKLFPSISQEYTNEFFLINSHSLLTDIAVKILSPVAITIFNPACSNIFKVGFVSSFNLFWTINNPKNINLLSAFSLVICWL